MATVSSFSPTAVLGQDGLGHDILGLNKTNDFPTTATITGTGFASGQTVNATCGTISWSGSLIPETGSTERGSVSLTCTNPSSSGGFGEAADVSVTVSNGITAASEFTVNVGTPPS